MALYDIVTPSGDPRAMVLELPAAAYTGSISDIIIEETTEHPGGILEMDSWDALIEGTMTAREAMRFILDTAAANTTGFPGSPIIKSLDGTKNRIEATLDVNRNRTIIARDPT